MVVNKELDSLLWIMKVTKPQEKLGEEWSGLLDENANQNHWQCLILHSVRRGEKSQLMYHIRHIRSHSNCKTCLESFEQTSALPWTLWGFADLHHTQCSRSQTSIFEECSFPGSLAAAAKGNLPCYVITGQGSFFASTPSVRSPFIRTSFTFLGLKNRKSMTAWGSNYMLIFEPDPSCCYGPGPLIVSQI